MLICFYTGWKPVRGVIYEISGLEVPCLRGQESKCVRFQQNMFTGFSESANILLCLTLSDPLNMIFFVCLFSFSKNVHITESLDSFMQPTGALDCLSEL